MHANRREDIDEIGAGQIAPRVAQVFFVGDGRTGNGEAAWNLISRNGQDVVSGIYLFVVESGQGTQRGGTITLPQMYAAAGAKFAFDAETLGQAVDLMVKTIAELEQI